MPTTHALAACAAFALATAAGHAAAPRSEPQPPFEINATVSGTAEGDAEFAGRSPGEIATAHLRASLTYRHVLSDAVRVMVGAGIAHVAIEAGAEVPVPERLNAEFADLGVTWSLAGDWTLLALARPGLYHDREVSGGDAFTVPGIVVAQRRLNDAWTIGAGVRVSPFDRNEVLPIALVRWQASPRWVFALGAPRTEAAFAWNARTTFYAGAALEGGAFAVDDPGVVPPPGYPGLRDTKLDYREIRLAVGARHDFTPTFRLQAEIGAAVGRRFDYFERALKIEADPAPSAALSVTGSF